MPEVIDFNGQKLIDASAISGIKRTLASSENIDNLRSMDDSGVYYCSNRSDTPTTYGMLIVMSAATTGTSGYQVFISSTVHVYVRYFSSNAWGNWYEIINLDTDTGVNGRLVRVTTTSDNKNVVNLGSNTLFPASSLYGSMKGRISSGDFNDYIGPEKAGMYYVSAGVSEYSNAPDGYGYLLVYSESPNLCYQVFGKSTGLWYRTYTSNNWNAWKKVLDASADANLPPIRVIGTGYDNSKLLDFGDGVLLSAAGVGGLKGTISSSGNIDSLTQLQQSGVYYCSNVPGAPAAYGMLVVHAASSGNAAAYQEFITTSGYIFKRYRSDGAWGDWYRFQGFPYGGENGINYTAPKTYLFQLSRGETKTVRFSGFGHGEIISSSAVANLRGSYVYYSAASGSVPFSAQAAAESLVITNTGNGISIKNNHDQDAVAYITVLIFTGNISAVV